LLSLQVFIPGSAFDSRIDIVNWLLQLPLSSDLVERALKTACTSPNRPGGCGSSVGTIIEAQIAAHIHYFAFVAYQPAPKHWIVHFF
jgi:hypothetical protein